MARLTGVRPCEGTGQQGRRRGRSPARWCEAVASERPTGGTGAARPMARRTTAVDGGDRGGLNGVEEGYRRGWGVMRGAVGAAAGMAWARTGAAVASAGSGEGGEIEGRERGCEGG